MNDNPATMAEDLELKMSHLIKGYEHLDMISSKVKYWKQKLKISCCLAMHMIKCNVYMCSCQLPSSILQMAAKHTKNLLGEVEILTPKVRWHHQLTILPVIAITPFSVILYAAHYSLREHCQHLIRVLLVVSPCHAQDREDFLGQQQVLGKVRHDLQGMAYERG